MRNSDGRNYYSSQKPPGMCLLSASTLMIRNHGSTYEPDVRSHFTKTNHSSYRAALPAQPPTFF